MGYLQNLALLDSERISVDCWTNSPAVRRNVSSVERFIPPAIIVHHPRSDCYVEERRERKREGKERERGKRERERERDGESEFISIFSLVILVTLFLCLDFLVILALCPYYC